MRFENLSFYQHWVYLPNGKLPDLQNRLQALLQQVPEPAIIVGDVNGHHQAWGGSKNNIRGNCVMEFACANDLVILNDGSPTFQNLKTSPKPGKRALHWWDETTKAAVKLRRKTLRTFKRAKDRLPPDHPGIALANENYKNARNACHQEIREAKEKSWKEFLDSINDQQSSAEL